ncbi:MAG: hypothetical protein WCT20_00750 [Candidatus Babeliales bacterium]
MQLIRSILVLLFTISTQYAAPQFTDFDAYQETTSRQEIESKINNYLLRNPTIGDFYTITDSELIMFTTPEKATPEFTLKFGAKQKPIRNIFKPNFNSDQPLAGLRVALDPGHLGGVMARIEDRFIDMKLAHKNNQHVQFDEGTLATATAKILRSCLVQLGAKVLLTREEPGQPVYQLSFSEWCIQELKITNENDWFDPKIQQTIINYLIAHGSSPEELNKRFDVTTLDKRVELIKQTLFRRCYNGYDLRARAEKINAFAPHLTIIIHYNAMEVNDTSKANYILTFIPGNFLKGELTTQQSHYEFLRLLLTDDLENSLALSSTIAQTLNATLNVPLQSKDNYQPEISRFVTDGVYCRNLALTRLVQSPLCYGETLIQNNPEVAEQLADASVRFEDFYTPPRVVQVAQAYLLGIYNYLGLKNVQSL